MNLHEHYEIVDNQCFLACGPCSKYVDKYGKIVYIYPTNMTVMFSCNVIIIPIVDYMRQTFGSSHEMDVENNSLVPTENGKYKMVSEAYVCEFTNIYLEVIRDKLLQTLDNHGLDEEKKCHVVRIIIQHRYMRDKNFVYSQSFDNCVRFLVAYISIEAAKGYNALMFFLSQNPQWPISKLPSKYQV